MRRVGAAIAIVAAFLVTVRHGEAAALRTPSSGTPGGEAPVLFVADEVQFDQELGLVVATGHVELSQKDQILLADTVTYNQRTDTVTASGHVSLLQPTGEVVFGDYVELRNDMRDGFITNIRMLLSDRSRLAGNTGRRIDGNRTELRRGVYSPCDLCREDPTRPPVWQIKAGQIVHDKEEQLVEFRDAVLEIDGFPVFYTPYLSHPDPSVKRRSGFLAPVIGSSSSLGAHTSIPYFWALDSDKDMTIAPILTTSGTEALADEYRQRFTNGAINLSGSLAYSNLSTTAGSPPPPEVRGHFFGSGGFDLNDAWRTAFDINRTTDQTYPRLFHFDTNSLSGLDPVSSGVNSAFLPSRAVAEGFTDRSYTLVDGYIYQDLRLGIGDTTQPIVIPRASYSWISSPDEWGGRWSLDSSALNLFRPNGTDIRRVSTGGGWGLPFNGAIGDRLTLRLSVRGDGYDSDNIGVAGSSATTNTGRSALAGRVYPQTELQWRYPWVRRGDGNSQTVEPIAALIVSPNGENPTTIPAEDNTGFEYDETSLFVPNRFPGFDRVDSGQRVDYGLRAAAYGDSGGNTRLLVGQSYRFQRSSSFPPGSGVDTQRSDVVGRLVVSPGGYLDLIYRFRLDRRDLTVRRQEATIAAGPPSLRLNLTYIDVAANPAVPGLNERRQLTGTLVAQLTRYWSVGVFGTQNIGTNAPTPTTTTTSVQTPTNPTTLDSGIVATYRDECLSFSATLAHSGASDRDIRPGTTVLFAIVLKNLGEVAVRAISTGATGATPAL